MSSVLGRLVLLRWFLRGFSVEGRRLYLPWRINREPACIPMHRGSSYCFGSWRRVPASMQCNSLTDFSQQRKPTRRRLTNGLKFLSWKATIHQFPNYYYFFVILFFTLLSMFKGCSLKIDSYLWLPSSTSGERVWSCAYFDWNSKHELCLVNA